jgi:hypothetical protein
MAAHALGAPDTPPRGVLLRAQVAWQRPWLDAALARGAIPDHSPALALRAVQLVDARRRKRFARSLRRAIEAAEGPPRGRVPLRGAVVPVCRAAVLEAGPELLALADDLVDIASPRPRGVVLAIRLLTDGGGPLYRPWTPEELRLAAERARRAL